MQEIDQRLRRIFQTVADRLPPFEATGGDMAGELGDRLRPEVMWSETMKPSILIRLTRKIAMSGSAVGSPS